MYLKPWICLSLILTLACFKSGTCYAIHSQFSSLEARFPTYFASEAGREGVKFLHFKVSVLTGVLREGLKHLGTTNWKTICWFLFAPNRSCLLLGQMIIKSCRSINTYFTFSVPFWKFHLFSIAAASSLFSHCCTIWLEPKVKGIFLSFFICTVSNFIS